tara:strand:- start:26 stop:1195 length:1170 start_codon:yes stop_codon:yes gene_type:complete
MSVFWNKNDTTRQLLFGSAFVEVPSSGGSGTSAITTDNSVIFDVNNDIDCLGDMFLNVKYTNTNAGATKSITPQQLAVIVNRIEIQVGTQIWQTFENADLLALASTELSSGSFADFCFQTSGGVEYGNQFINGAPGTVAANGVANAYLPIKLFTKTLGPLLENFAEQTESGYLMAAAPHQSVKIKVYTHNSAATPNEGNLELALYAKNQVMCNEEREQMKAMPMGLPKRLKMTQNKSYSIAAANSSSLDIDLDIFSLYASHIIISIPKGTLTVATLYSGYAELLLNSSSFSGKLPLGLLKLTGSSMGLFTNEYWDSTGSNSANFTFVFPLASRAYGGSSVPLNRFDNIRLKLTGLPASSGLAVGNIVNVTCVGETTALYKSGAASLAMY